MKTRQEYDHSKLMGIDADIETSLKEYGLAWIETDKDILFYYGIGYGPLNDEYDDNMEGYVKFDFGSFPVNLDVTHEFDWADFGSIYSFTGMDKDSWFDLDLPQQINDMLQYYGYELVFGSSYWEGLTYDQVVNGS